MPLIFIRNQLCATCIHVKEYNFACTYDCFKINNFPYYNNGKDKKGIMEFI